MSKEHDRAEQNYGIALLHGAIPAAQEFLARQRRERHPIGKTDKNGRWYPDSEREYRECCYQCRAPTKQWPWSMMLHCRTAKHVATVYGVDERIMKRAVAAIRKGVSL